MTSGTRNSCVSFDTIWRHVLLKTIGRCCSPRMAKLRPGLDEGPPAPEAITGS